MAHYKIRAHTTFLTLLLLSLNIITTLTETVTKSNLKIVETSMFKGI
jgi:hypothetical protein